MSERPYVYPSYEEFPDGYETYKPAAASTVPSPALHITPETNGLAGLAMREALGGFEAQRRAPAQDGDTPQAGRER